MKILSIDVGMKFLAYCLFDLNDTNIYTIKKWGVLNLCGEELHKCCGKTKKNKNCDKNSKFHKNGKYYCKIHAKNQNFKIPSNELKKTNIKKLKLKELALIVKKYDIDVSSFGGKKIKKTKYHDLIFNELDTYYLNFVEQMMGNPRARSGV